MKLREDAFISKTNGKPMDPQNSQIVNKIYQQMGNDQTTKAFLGSVDAAGAATSACLIFQLTMNYFL